ncbi:MAG: glycosyltransferase family 39 protein [Gemmatimonadaceae bacterium]|nr:glycosyltransferase family 39 protein [Gemmatimonadaceae bacterium]
MTGTPTPIPARPSGPQLTPRSTAAIVAGPSVAWRQALWLIAAATLARLMLGAIVPLFPDEAYYWEWSRHLQPGYFDHPGVLAYAIALGTAVFGDTNIGVRVLPILFGAVASLAVAATARRLAGDIAARFAALVLAVMPLSAAGFVLATPDAPLLAFEALTLLALTQALAPGANAREQRRAWLAAGVAIGLAMASKYTAVLIPATVAFGIALHPELRKHFGKPGPYLAVATASMVLLPVLLWNAQHDWISFRFQLAHGLGSTARGAWWQRELDLLGGQIGLVSPLLFGAFLRASWRAANPHGEPRRFVFAVVTLSCLGFFIYSATRRPVEANWPAIAWVSALLLAAASRPMLRTRWERAAVWVAGVLTLLALSHVVAGWWPLPPTRDPVARAHGWRRASTEVAAVMAAESATAGAPVLVAANRYQDAALLAFHLPSKPRTFSLNLAASRGNQYDLWPALTAAASPGATLLYVLDVRAERVDRLPDAIVALQDHFASVERGPRIALQRGNAEEHGARRVWIFRGWRGSWPLNPTSDQTLP